MQKVAGAIKRVDDEAGFALCPCDFAAFFHQEAPVGTRDFQFAEDRIFCALVSLRHKVCRSLLRNLQMFDFAKVTAQFATRFTGSFFHNGQQTGKRWH